MVILCCGLALYPLGVAAVYYLPSPAHLPAIMLICAGAGAIGYLRERHERLPERRREQGMCVRCGYDLRGTPQRCPECGTEAR
jgi:hypothetical protein